MNQSVINNLVTKINSKEQKSNKVASWNSTPSDDKYPSEKLVKDSLDGKANSIHNQASSTITDSHTYINIGNVANTQESINSAIDTKLGQLSNIDAINVVSTLPTASSSTMGKLYIISEYGVINVYYTEEDNGSYSWHEMDADILDELSIDWIDIVNNPFGSALPEDYATSSHSHGNITSDGTIGSASGYLLITSTGGTITSAQTVSSSKINDSNAHSNIGSSANDTQSTINSAINTALGNKANTSDLGAVALSNSYNDLTNKPNIPSASSTTPSADTTNGSVGDGTTWARSNHTHPKSSIYAEATHTHSQYLTSHQDISGKEDLSNKVTSISPSSTDTQYPSAKCTYDNLNSVYDNFIFNENLTPYTHILSNYTNTSNATLSVTNEVLTITGNGASNGETGLSNTKVFAPITEDYIISFDIQKATGTYTGKDFNIVIGDNNNYLSISPQYYIIRFGENGTKFDTVEAIRCTTYTNLAIQRTDGTNWKFYMNNSLIHSFSTSSSEIPNQITFYGLHDNDVVDVKNVKITRKRIDSSNELVDMIYPVGSIYMSVNNVSPQYLFGGTWTQITDTFLLACGSTYASDGANVHTAQHGEATHTLTSAESGQKNLGTVTSTGGSHSHKISSTDTKARFLGTTSDGDGITRNSVKPGTSTAVSNFLKSVNSILRYDGDASSGSLSVSTTISGSDATSSHNNMPPYMAVYMWKRTA